MLSPRRARIADVLLLLAFALGIFGAKLWLIREVGTSSPLLDQWDGIGEHLLRPWLEGRFEFASLFSPHNEHRIALTRSLSLGLFVLNGQWDSRLETVVNATLHTGFTVFFVLLARRWLEGWRHRVFALLVLLLHALPFAWENTVYAFQSQFYFLQLCSIVHLAGSVAETRFRPRWWIAQGAGVLALGAMASGFFSSAALLGATALRWWRLRRLSAPEWAAAGVALACIAVGLGTRAVVTAHSSLASQDAGQFLQAVIDLASWPGTSWRPLSLIVAVPLVVFAIRAVRRGLETPADTLLFAVGGWLALQLTAMAYARGGSGAILSSRYLDLVLMVPLLSFVALAREAPARRCGWLVAAWLLAFGFGAAERTVHYARYLSEHQIARIAGQEEITREYLATGDEARLRRYERHELPYPDAGVIVLRLASPALRATMPAAVRSPLAITPMEGSVTPPLRPALRAPVIVSSWGEPPAPGEDGGMRQWRSAVQPATTLPILRLWIAAQWPATPGAARPSVRVVSEAGSVELLRPEAAPDRWRSINVSRPAGAWWIEAELPADGASWAAVTAPIEVGRWSYLVEKLLKHVSVIGGLALLLGFGGTWLEFPRWRSSGPGPSGSPEGSAAASGPALSNPDPGLVARAATPRATLRPGTAALWAAAASLAVCGVLLLRKTDVLLHPQLWAEDSSVFFLGNDLHGAAAIFTPYAGYLHLLPRLIAWLGTPFAPGGTPAFFVGASLAWVLVVVVRLYSPRVDLPGKLWLALAIVLVPHQSEVFLSITNIHWVTALLFPVLYVSADARTWGQHARDVALAVAIGLSGPFSILAAPFFTWRAWQRRSRASLILGGTLLACALVQGVLLLVSAPARPPAPGSFELWPALAVVSRRLPVLLTWGPGAASWLTPAVTVGAGAALLGALAWLTWRWGARREAVVAFWVWFGVLVAAAALRDRFDRYGFDDLHNGDRYFYAPRVLLLWLLGLVATWRHTVGWIALGLCGLALAVNLSRFRFPPYVDYHWENYCERLRAGEPVVVPTNPAGWSMTHPGRPAEAR